MNKAEGSISGVGDMVVDFLSKAIKMFPWDVPNGDAQIIRALWKLIN